MFRSKKSILSCVLLLVAGLSGISYATDNPFWSYCDPAQPVECGSWQTGTNVCTPQGGTCVSAITGSDCVVVWYPWYCTASIICDGFCQNNPTEMCFGSTLWC